MRAIRILLDGISTVVSGSVSNSEKEKMDTICNKLWSLRYAMLYLDVSAISPMLNVEIRAISAIALGMKNKQFSDFLAHLSRSILISDFHKAAGMIGDFLIAASWSTNQSNHAMMEKVNNNDKERLGGLIC